MKRIIRTKTLLLCLAVVLTVHRTAFAQVSVFPEFLNFDEVAVGQAVSLSLVIKNQGESTVVVNDINFSHAYFHVTDTSFFIAPLVSQIIIVTFS
ncbi:MAG: hypothetical protein IIB42_07160, partial [Candidatus Marinimicrobia bacterium]|nr:hypothetical protein [Candidatus Neomarinimicrobiota bacterium]